MLMPVFGRFDRLLMDSPHARISFAYLPVFLLVFPGISGCFLSEKTGINRCLMAVYQ